MKTWLITHNPDNWQWPNFEDVIRQTKNGNMATESWTCSSKSVSLGDRVFVMRTGDKGRGIFAAGHCTRESYDAPHYDPVKAANGEVAAHIDVEFDWIQNPESEDIIDSDTLLAKFPSQTWTPMQSGISIDDSIAPGLEKLWTSLIGIENNFNNLLKIQSDIVADDHDGSYELVRTIVDKYSSMKTASGLGTVDYHDLDLVYLAVVGTWSDGIDKKKEHVLNSNLPQASKDDLLMVLDNIWSRANAGDYANRESGNPSIGMFSSGFHTFNTKVKDDTPRGFIDLLIQIKALTNEHDIYEKAKEILNLDLAGIGVATVSEILHCLKPELFFISNNKVSHVVKLIDASLDDSGTIEAYLNNCEPLKQHISSNYLFRNYRVLDMAVQLPEKDEDIAPSNGVFLVFQREGKNGLFAKESAAGHMEAPKQDKRGRCPHHWKRMENLKKDDIVFHISGKAIAAVSTVEVPTYDHSGNYMADCNYRILLNRVALAPFNTEIKTVCKSAQNAPFNKYGTGNQGYLFDLPDGLIDLFVDEVKKANPTMDLAFLDNIRNKTNNAGNNSNSVGGVKMNAKIGLNTILYGPPGTGKTYNTKRYVVAICDGKTLAEVNGMDYETEVTPRYDELVKEGRVKFTTFHQSYGYEEFIEGIKPIVDEENNVLYDTLPGVFKKFCDDAKNSTTHVDSIGVDPNSPIWKMSLYGGKTDILKECFDEDYIRIGFDINSSDLSMNIFKNKMQIGDIVLSLKSFYEINGIAIIDGDVEVLTDKTEFKVARKVKWLFKDKVINVREINGGNRLPLPTCRAMSKISRTGVMDLIKDNTDISIDEEAKPYVFVIDEINRGNISKIFGELITLIEESKRGGNKEAMSATLPYSGVQFSVPNNVYILGTMNTADRSISLMDTALRRRFDFVEMMPDANVVASVNVCGVDIKAMLEAINKRIEVLYDREHTIGHAFFTGLTTASTVDDLACIFKNKVIPLLQEYFYEDYSKIRLVLGDNAKPDANQFVKEVKNHPSIIFKGSVTEEVADVRYEINESAYFDIDSYKEIY